MCLLQLQVLLNITSIKDLYFLLRIQLNFAERLPENLRRDGSTYPATIPSGPLIVRKATQDHPSSFKLAALVFLDDSTEDGLLLLVKLRLMHY